MFNDFPRCRKIFIADKAPFMNQIAKTVRSLDDPSDSFRGWMPLGPKTRRDDQVKYSLGRTFDRYGVDNRRHATWLLFRGCRP